MADQKISELQLVVATGVAATGIYVPLYTPMLAPANRRISAAEFFKTPKRIEVSDPALAGNGEVMTLTSSYGTVSLRAGTGGQFIVGGNLAAVGEVAVVSDSQALKLGSLSDVGLQRTASGVVRVINSSGGYATLESSNVSVTPTWSGTGTATTPLVVNVTADPGPASGSSKLLDLSVLGTSRAYVNRDGTLFALGQVQSPFFTTTSTNGAGFYARSNSNPTLSFGTSDDLVVTRDNADILAQRRSTNANSFRVYRTYQNSGTDHERGVFGWHDSSGVAGTTLRIGTEKGGMGTARSVSIVTDGVERLNLSTAGLLTNTSQIVLNGTSTTAQLAHNGTPLLQLWNGGQVDISSTAHLGFGSTGVSSPDIAIRRSSAGVLKVTNGSTGFGQLDAKRVTLTGETATTNAPMVSGTQTWNDGGSGVTFVGLGFNITDNGSSAASKALDIQVNGTGVLSVQKNGTVSTNYFVTAAAASAGLYARSNTGLVSFGVSDDAVITRDAADVIAQRRATNAQNFRVYNSYVSASVNEYLSLGFSNSTAQIGTLRSGSGIVRDLNILSSGIPRITVPASHNTAVSVSGSLNVSGTFTGINSPGLAVAQTWNNATTDFTALTVDIIPQNAGSNSNFIEFKSSGTSYAKLTQFGDWQSSSFTPSDLSSRMGSSGIKMGSSAQYAFVNSTSAASSLIDTGLARAGSGVVRVTDGFAGTGSITVRNTNSTVFTITDSAGVDINPASGAIQVWTLGATRTPTANNFNAGQSVTLMVDDGSGFSINWGTMAVSWLNSTPPALPTSGYGVIELWKVGSTIYGTSVGNVV